MKEREGVKEQWKTNKEKRKEESRILINHKGSIYKIIRRKYKIIIVIM